MDKRKTLRTQVLPTIATNRTLQRIVAKYEFMLSEQTQNSNEDDSTAASKEPSETIKAPPIQ